MDHNKGGLEISLPDDQVASVQDAVEGKEDKGRAGLMGGLTQSKEPAAGATPPSKPGRFANLRAKLARPGGHAEVNPPMIYAT